MNSIAVSLGEVTFSQELCEDAAVSLSLFNDDSKKFIQATGSSIATGTDPTDYYRTNTWSRALTEQEKTTYWCLISSGNSTDWVGNGGWLIGWLPSSPESARIPTQIQNLFGDGTLAAALMLELYSSSWQLLLIFAVIKFYRLIPFKAT